MISSRWVPGRRSSRNASSRWSSPSGASIHLLAHSELLLTRISRGRALSFAGGVSVAYVFVHVLPEIDDFRQPMNQHPLLAVPTEKEVYLVTMLGFITYYGLEQLANRSAEQEGDDKPSPGIFRVHVGAYAAYNAIVGYLLFHQETPASAACCCSRSRSGSTSF
ncbi:hypothetical protein ACFQL4_28900 [Halosimplex aquaticum]